MSGRTDVSAENGLSVVIPVYRDTERALRLIHALEHQSAAVVHALQVIVVDDGSQPHPDDRLAASGNPFVELLHLPRNLGRSAARNAGAQRARSPVIVFLDCDCEPATGEFLAAHLRAVAQGNVASVGPVAGVGGGFWDRYQRLASERRRQQHANGRQYVGVSSNLAISRPALEQLGGFDEEYGGYGFEDRDLLIRLSELGPIAWTQEAGVLHTDELSMTQVARKLREAGQHGADRFAQRHPAEYRALGYAAADARVHVHVALTVKLAKTFVPALARLTDWLIQRRLPFGVLALLVRATGALSYMHGTQMASAQAGRTHDGGR